MLVPMSTVCMTCHGSGEVGTDSGPEPCPDCFGGGTALSPSARLEWRLSRIESGLSRLDREVEADTRWLIQEVRRSRAALLQILSRCQDAASEDANALAIKYAANEALEIYERTADRPPS
jgi:hypothetical protein